MSNNKKIKDFSNKPVPDVTDAFLLEAADGTYYYVTQLQLAGSITAGYLTYLSDTAAGWTSNNPILPDGSIGIESDTMLTSPKFKIAFSSNHWNDLPYANVSLSGLTTNKVLKATSSTTAGDSSITDDGTKVTVNGGFYATTGASEIFVYGDTANITADGQTNTNIETNLTENILRHNLKNTFDAPANNFPQLTASQIVATDASKNLVSLPVATYPSLTELSYGKGVTSAIQTQLDGKLNNLINKVNTTIYHTGTTAATVIHSYEIPVGACLANDFVKFYIRHASTNNANSKTLKLWANTSNTIVGATQLSTYTYTTNSGGVFWFRRTMFFQNSLTSQKIINATVNHANDEVSYPNNGDTTLALDFSASVWILIEVTLANAADTFTLKAYINKVER